MTKIEMIKKIDALINEYESTREQGYEIDEFWINAYSKSYREVLDIMSFLEENYPGVYKQVNKKILDNKQTKENK